MAKQRPCREGDSTVNAGRTEIRMNWVKATEPPRQRGPARPLQLANSTCRFRQHLPQRHLIKIGWTSESAKPCPKKQYQVEDRICRTGQSNRKRMPFGQLNSQNEDEGNKPGEQRLDPLPPHLAPRRGLVARHQRRHRHEHHPRDYPQRHGAPPRRPPTYALRNDEENHCLDNKNQKQRVSQRDSPRDWQNGQIHKEQPPVRILRQE